MVTGDLQTDSETDVQQDIIQDVEWIVDETAGGGGWTVFVHNDDVTPWDFVIDVLRTVFELAQQKAESVTSRAHAKGSAPVAMFAKEEAKHRVGKAHGMARGADYPLKFTIESE